MPNYIRRRETMGTPPHTYDIDNPGTVFIENEPGERHIVVEVVSEAIQGYSGEPGQESYYPYVGYGDPGAKKTRRFLD